MTNGNRGKTKLLLIVGLINIEASNRHILQAEMRNLFRAGACYVNFSRQPHGHDDVEERAIDLRTHQYRSIEQTYSSGRNAQFVPRRSLLRKFFTSAAWA